jgi:hypothetical protein
MYALSFCWVLQLTIYTLGCAIAQAVSRWLPTAVARVRVRVWSCRICGGQSGTGSGFLRVLRFPLPIFSPPIAPQSPSSIIWGLYNRPEVAAVPSGLRPTPLIIKKKIYFIVLWFVDPLKQIGIKFHLILSSIFNFQFLATPHNETRNCKYIILTILPQVRWLEVPAIFCTWAALHY